MDKQCKHNVIFGLTTSNIAVVMFIIIIAVLTTYFIMNNDRQNRCIPDYEQKYWIHYIRDLVRDRSMILSALNNVKDSDRWTRWAEYDSITDTPKFTQMTHDQIISLMNRHRCRLNEGKRSWKLYGLILNKEPIEENYEDCRELVDRLLAIPNVLNAGFSCFEPGTTTTLHRGYNGKIIRCHIPLIVPDGDTAIKIKDTVVKFKEIEKDKGYFIFNDTCNHIAWNSTANNRIVLIIDLIK